MRVFLLKIHKYLDIYQIISMQDFFQQQQYVVLVYSKLDLFLRSFLLHPLDHGMHHKSLLKIIIRRNDVRTFQPFNKQIQEPGPYKRCFGVWTIRFSIVFLCLAVSFDSFRGCKNPQHKMESFLMFLRFINTYLELFRGTISAKLVDFLGCICRGKCLPAVEYFCCRKT